MVEIEESVLRSIAAKFGLSVQFVYKEYKLMQVVGECIRINADAQLPLVMKGGTALNKIYFGELQRFSEDIDFDYRGDRKELIAFMKNMVAFSVQGPWRVRQVIRFHCVYTFRHQTDYIRLEFNIGAQPQTAQPLAVRPITSALFGITHTGLSSYAFDDLVAQKLQALKNRCEGKDVWDCFHALPKTTNIKKAISMALGIKGTEVRNFFKEVIHILETSDVKELAQTTNQYIPLSLRPPNWHDMVRTLISRLELLE